VGRGTRVVVDASRTSRLGDDRHEVPSSEGAPAANWSVVAGGAPGADDGERTVWFVAPHERVLRPEQRPDLLGDRGEQLLLGDPARHQCRDPPQRRLLFSEPAEPGAALGIRDRGHYQLSKRGEARLGVRRQRLVRF
jgi:hypothetical protein